MFEPTLVSLILPTLNEAANIESVINRTIAVLSNNGIKLEILIIDDDSVDMTADIAEAALSGKGRVIRRKSKERSLSLSVLEGMAIAKGDVIVVMDADGSHPPEKIPEFLYWVRQSYDLVIGSRYCKGARSVNFPFARYVGSLIACGLGRILTHIKDNTSGFFCIKKQCLEGVALTPYGFKIGLEIFIKAKVAKYKEIPYTFLGREKGKSKLGLQQMAQFINQVITLFKYQHRKIKNKSR